MAVRGLSVCACACVWRAYKDLNTLKEKLMDDSRAHSQCATRTLVCRTCANTHFHTLARSHSHTHLHAGRTHTPTHTHSAYTHLQTGEYTYTLLCIHRLIHTAIPGFKIFQKKKSTHRVRPAISGNRCTMRCMAQVCTAGFRVLGLGFRVRGNRYTMRCVAQV